jgi:hypothetical protein
MVVYGGVYGGVCMVVCMVYGGVYGGVCDRQSLRSSGARTSNTAARKNIRFGTLIPMYSCMVRGAGYTLKLFMSLEWTCFFFDTYLHSLLNTMSSLKRLPDV